jgi:hypothetical protein
MDLHKRHCGIDIKLWRFIARVWAGVEPAGHRRASLEQSAFGNAGFTHGECWRCAVGAIFGGLAPGFVGLYQVNFVVPPNAPGGTVNITVTLNGVTSAPAQFAVAP